jgi:SAM-dependent methyltransferase
MRIKLSFPRMQRLSQQPEKMEQLQLPEEIPVDEGYARLAGAEDEEEEADLNSALSLASTKYNFHMENGRLYQDYRSGHPFPHDEMAKTNEKLLHAMLMYILEDKLIAAPVDGKSLRYVLDVGTGMGMWAEGVADKYEKSGCQVVAVDMVPLADSVLPNLEVLCFDVTQDWIFNRPVKFDLIHMRCLFASIPPDHWPQLYKQCLE